MRLELGATPLHYCRVLHQNKTEGNLAYPGVQVCFILLISYAENSVNGQH